MKIKVCDNLKLLAISMAKQNHILYVVGGFVRNSIMEIGNTDYDICSSMQLKQVIEICNSLNFKTQIINEKLGTLKITTETEQYEYTAFRSEVYGENGAHSPNSVEFISDAKSDALRRDFTINAIYYDVLNDEISDYFNGLNDISKKIIRTVNSPEVVFNSDGLRILRLVRFICELNFKPEKNTLKTAKTLALKVKDISRERILKELKLSANGSLKYKLKTLSHKHLVKYYNQLGLWQFVFNSNFFKFKIKPYGKLYHAYLKSGGDNRFVALMCLVLNNYMAGKTTDANIVMCVNTLLGVNGLKASNKTLQEIMDAYRFVNLILYSKIDLIVTNENCIMFNNLSFEIKNYLSLVSEGKVNKIKLQILNLKKQKVPFNMEELKISNADLMDKLRIKPNNVSKIKNVLYKMCVKGSIINDNQILIEQAKFINENLKNSDQ